MDAMTLWLLEQIQLLPGKPATTLPGSPLDTEQAILVDSVSAPTFRWLLQYNGAEAHWDVIGPSPLYAEVLTEEGPASSGSFVNLATDGPSITLPAGVGGDFYVEGHCTVSNTSGGIQGCYLGVSIGNTAPTLQSEVNEAIGGRNPLIVKGKLTGVAAASTIKLRYDAASTTSVAFAYRYLTVWPLKIT